MDATICAAIRGHKRLRFYYDGKLRIVEPYCHGATAPGNEALRAVQVAGESRSGMGFGKLWLVAKMRELRVTDESFVADDPSYNPNDSAMASIHCRVSRMGS